MSTQNKKLKKTGTGFIRWVPALALMALIFGMSQHHNIQTGLEGDFYFKKLAHLVEYGALALCFYFALTEPVRRWARDHALKAWLWASLYGLSDEVHQYFVPTRSARFRDVLIDSSGAALAMLVLWFLLRKRASKPARR